MQKHMIIMKPYIAVMMIQMSFAGMFLFSKIAISDSGMKPSVFVVYRQAFATFALAPFAFIFSKSSSSATSPPLSWQSYCKILINSSFGIALTLNLSLTGLKYTSATFATAMLNVVPVLVFIMAVCFRMERVAMNQWHGMAKVLGTILGLAGAMVFTFYKGHSLYSNNPSYKHQENSHSLEKTHTTKEWIKGSFLMMVAMITWSLWLTMQGPLLKQFPGKLRLTFLQCGFSCLTATIYCAAVERDISSWKLGWNVNLVAVAYCGIVVNGISYWLQAWVIEKKGAVFSAIFGPLGLIFAAFFSALFLKETLYLGSVLGGILLVGGLYSFLWGKSKEEQCEAQQNLDHSKEDAPLESIITSVSLPPTNQLTVNPRERI